jgi:Cytosine deaminase and related metal-dependent hydrolases
MSILVKEVEFEGKATDIYIEGNIIKKIGSGLSFDAGKIIDGKRKAAIPGFVNCHTHSAMTLFRGFGDDMPLMPWLKERIWPNEAKMTDEDVYWGTKLACLEMIKSGTTTFFDMYRHPAANAKATEEMGLRGVLSFACFDHFDPGLREQSKAEIKRLYAKRDKYSDRLKFALGPHAIYTVSGDFLKWINEFSEENDLLIHLHLSETEWEVKKSIDKFGLSPVRYLHKLGVLSSRLVVAHALYMDDEEIDLLAKYNVKVAHNPASNLKLASGYRFKYDEMRKAGMIVGLGTDGCGSSNNLDMIEAMRYAAFIGKAWRGNPEVLTAEEMYQSATEHGAMVAGVNAGMIKEGMLADIALIDLNTPAFTPNFNFISNLVYAANGSNVDTVICDGKVLMESRKVEGEDEIIERAAKTAYDLVSR